MFGLEGVSGVGVSFGADRIYDVLTHLNQFNEMKTQVTTAMVVNFGDKELNYCLRILENLHDINISAEIYPEPAKMKKQLAYADSKKIQYVIIAGEDEIKNNEVTIKNMLTGEQKKIRFGELKSFFK